MAVITLDGAKIKTLTITRDAEGKLVLNGSYEVMSSAGVAIAKSNFNAYDCVTLNQSPDTAKLLSDALAGLGMDLNTTLGFG